MKTPSLGISIIGLYNEYVKQEQCHSQSGEVQFPLDIYSCTSVNNSHLKRLTTVITMLNKF